MLKLVPCLRLLYHYLREICAEDLFEVGMLSEGEGGDTRSAAEVEEEVVWRWDQRGDELYELFGRRGTTGSIEGRVEVLLAGKVSSSLLEDEPTQRLSF